MSLYIELSEKETNLCTLEKKRFFTELRKSFPRSTKPKKDLPLGTQEVPLSPNHFKFRRQKNGSVLQLLNLRGSVEIPKGVILNPSGFALNNHGILLNL
jgi:hypothetical protein